MKASIARAQTAIASQFFRWLMIALGFTALYYGGLLLALIIRFEELPNYVTIYDWPGNIVRIFASTPSWIDAAGIARDEWLLETGYINYQYGLGISEWSMTLVPLKLGQILLLGFLIATIVVLATDRARTCPGTHRAVLALSTGTGVFSVGLTGATTSWVVCCSTPTWIVSLAMLGMSVPTAIWLEPIGPWLSLAGFVALLATVLALSLESTSAEARRSNSESTHFIRPGGTTRRNKSNEPRPA